MKKFDLIRLISIDCGYTFDDTAIMVESFFRQIRKSMLAGHAIHIPNVCKLTYNINRPREVWNPRDMSGHKLMPARAIPKAVFFQKFRAEMRKIPVVMPDKKKKRAIP